MPSRVLPLVGMALALVLGLWAGGPSAVLAAPPTPSGTPAPVPTATAKPSPSPTCPQVGCLPTVVRPTRTPSPPPKATPSATATRTAAASPTRSRKPRSEPRTDPTFTAPAQTVAPVATETLDAGGLASPSAKPATTKSASSSSDKITQVFGLVLLTALALGFAGLTGLYVTRRRPLH